MRVAKYVLVPLLSLALISTSVVTTKAGDLEEAIKQQQQLQNQQNQAKGKLNELTYSADIMKKQISELNQQIAVAQTNLSEKEALYKKAEIQAEVAQKELDNKLQEFEQRRQAFRKRVKAIYESGQLSYLEILFQSSDLGDFIDRVEYLSKLVANDRKLLTDIQTEKEQIAKKTEELKTARDNAAKLKVQAAAAKSNLDNKKSMQQVALSENKKSQQALFDQIDKLEADSNALADKIRQLQASRKGGVVGTVNTWPMPGYYTISSPFGWRIHPITGKRKLHTGTDIPAPTGTPIRAAGAGEVIYAGWYGAYGNAVVIDHGGGYSTLYGHQSRLNVSVGQNVTAGDIIGYCGSTGWSTGPHLHFEVRVGGNPTDPLQYFP